MAETKPRPPFRTSDMTLAAYAMLLGKQLLDVEQNGALATFVFEPDAADLTTEFYGGAAAPAQEYASQLAGVKRLIHQTRQAKERSR